jgi:hypothetical protein
VSRRKQVHLFNTAAECRAKAASLRTMSAYAQSSASKAKMLTMAVEWDDRAAAYDSSIYTVSPGFSHG